MVARMTDFLRNRLEFSSDHATCWSDVVCDWEEVNGTATHLKPNITQADLERELQKSYSVQSWGHLAKAVIEEGRRQGVEVIIKEHEDEIIGVTLQAELALNWLVNQHQAIEGMKCGVILRRDDLTDALRGRVDDTALNVQVDEPAVCARIRVSELRSVLFSIPDYADCIAVDMARWMSMES